METTQSIRKSLQVGQWTTSLDLKDAYFHIPMAPSVHKLLRFQVLGKLYQFVAMPFDLATAPREFTTLVKEVKRMALTLAISVHMYLDDWLIKANSCQEAHSATLTLLGLTHKLGWIVNREKSDLLPKQVFTFLGQVFDLSKGVCYPTEARFLSIQEAIHPLLFNPFTYFIYLFGVLRRFQHCTGHITMGSWKGRGNQYIEFARIVYCKLPTNGKQLPAFPLKAMTGIEPRPQRWEARVLPLCHRGPFNPFTTPRQVMHLLGLLASTEKLVPQGRLHMRHLQFHLKRNFNCHLKGALDSPFSLDPSVKVHLRWWLLRNNVMAQAPLHPPKYVTCIYTDASAQGWGAHCAHMCPRSLFDSAGETAHQCSGAQSCAPGSQDFCPSVIPSSKDYSGSLRQHNCLCLHKQTRGHSLLGHVCPDLAPVCLLSQEQGCSFSKTCSRGHESCDRPTLQV